MAKKGGKYAAVIGSLPALGIDPSRREAVEKLQEQIKAPPTELDAAGFAVDPVLQRAEGFIKYVVEAKKRQTAGKPWASEYARAYAECRAIRDRIAEWDASFSLLVEAYFWLMIEQMEVEGTTALTLANGQPIHTFKEPTAKVDDPAAFLAWCLAPRDACMTCGRRAEEHVTAFPGEDADDRAVLDQVDFGIELSGSVPTTAEVDAAITATLEARGCVRDHAFKPGGGLTSKLALPWGTTNALTKAMLLEGEPEPPGVSVWAKTTVRLGKGDE